MKKFSKAILAGTTLTLLLASCGDNNKKAADNANVKPKETVITYWGFPNFTGDSEYKTAEAFDKALIQAFEAKHPDIKVNYQKIDFTDGPAKIQTALQSNTAPDVVVDAPGRIIAWAKGGYLVPFNSIDKSKYSDLILKASSVDGNVYLYPLGSQPFLMAFNKKLTDKLGVTKLLPLNKPGRNWTPKEFAKFLEAVHKKDPKLDPVLFYTKSQAGDQGPRAFVSNMYNSWITNPEVTKYTINNPNGVKGLSYIKELYNKELLGKGVSAEAKDALEEFRSGQAVGTILYSAGLKAIDSKLIKEGKLDPVFVAFPNESGQAKYEFLLAGPCVFNNNDPARVKASQEFVNFMINDPVWGPRALKATKNFSPIKGVTGTYGTNDPEVNYLESLNKYYGPYYNTIDGYTEMRPLWFNMVQSVLNNPAKSKSAIHKEVKSALDKFAKNADQTIQNAK